MSPILQREQQHRKSNRLWPLLNWMLRHHKYVLLCLCVIAISMQLFTVSRTEEFPDLDKLVTADDEHLTNTNNGVRSLNTNTPPGRAKEFDAGTETNTANKESHPNNPNDDARSTRDTTTTTANNNRAAARQREIAKLQKMAQKEQLNVILFYPDDWRHDDLGDVSPVLQTPFFTRLAQEGIRFTQNAVTTSVCWISRATLFTGQYGSKHNSLKVRKPNFALADAWKNTWPYRLQQEAGYFVGHVGKWQYRQKGYKIRHLFNWTTIFEDSSFWYNVHPNPDPNSFWYNGYKKKTKVHIIDRCKEEALRFLANRPTDHPFALTVAFYPPKGAVHPDYATNESQKQYENDYIPEHPTHDALEQLPYFLQNNKTEARERFLYRWDTPEKYQTGMKVYYSLISHIDAVCGQIVEELKRQGIYNKTMIIVSADNGEFHSAHALSDKWYPYQESIRVPLIIYDPRMPSNKQGVLNDSFTLNIDLAETILGAAGIQANDTVMQGRDIADLYLPDRPTSTSKVPWRTEWYYEFPPISKRIEQSSALVRRDWKYIKWHKYGYEQLFNLKDDPLEMNDLRNTSKYVALLDEMRKQHDVLKTKAVA